MKLSYMHPIRTMFLAGALALLAPALSAQTPGPLVKWTDLETAQKAAKKDGKPLLIDVYTSWCGPCRMLDANTFGDKQTADYINANYHPVKFNAEGGEPVVFNGKTYTNPGYNPGMANSRNATHELTMAMAPVNGRVAYPTIVYMDSQGQILTPVQGYMTPEQIEPILRYFGDGEYKKGTEFSTYQASFKSKRGPAAKP